VTLCFIYTNIKCIRPIQHMHSCSFMNIEYPVLPWMEFPGRQFPAMGGRECSGCGERLTRILRCCMVPHPARICIFHHLGTSCEVVGWFSFKSILVLIFFCRIGHLSTPHNSCQPFSAARTFPSCHGREIPRT